MHDAAVHAFPKTKDKFIHGDIDEYIHKRLIDRNRSLVNFQRIVKLCSRAHLYFCFQVWAGCWGKVWFSFLHGFVPPKTLKRSYHAQCRLAFNNYGSKWLVECDKNIKREQKAIVLAESLAKDNIECMYSGLRQFKDSGGGGFKITRVVGANGVPASDSLQEKAIFRHHFSQQLDGQTVSFESLVIKDRYIDSSISQEQLNSLTLENVANYLPTLFNLTGLMSRTPSFKAFGEDLIMGVLNNMFPKNIVRLLYPLAFKSFVRVGPPLQWKGGMLQELLKPKGASGDCNSYRDVMLSNFSGKGVYKLIRKQLIPYASELVGLHQFGSGFNGGETAFAHI